MADDAKHALAAVDSLAHLLGARQGHVAVRFVVQRPHDDAVAEQPARVVDFGGREPHAAQDGLTAIGLEAAERYGHVDDGVAAVGRTTAATGRDDNHRHYQNDRQETLAHHAVFSVAFHRSHRHSLLAQPGACAP